MAAKPTPLVGERDRPRYWKSEIAKRKILDAAAALFAQKGFSAVTLRQIAARSGVNVGSIYYCFKAKDDIYVTVAEIGAESVAQTVRSHLRHEAENLPPAAVLRKAMEMHLIAVLRGGKYSQASIRAFQDSPARVHRRINEVRGSYEAFWTKMIAQAQRQGILRADIESKLVCAMLLGALNATLTWYRGDARSASGLQEFARAYCDLLLAGLMPRENEIGRLKRSGTST